MAKDGWEKWHGEKDEVPDVVVASENQSGGITANEVTINQTVNVDSPRRVGGNAKELLIKALGGIGKTPITISITNGDSEAFSYARILSSILVEAGCNIQRKERVVFNPEYAGLNIKIANEDVSRDAAILFRGIQRLDAQAKIIKDKRFDPGYLAVIVGPKGRRT